MKQFANALILFAAVGAFLSGFVFWMAHSSHRQAEQLRQRGHYCEVDVVGMHTSCPGEDSSTSHYVEVQPVGAAANSPRITCSVIASTYDGLHVGQRLKAWVSGSDALLDYGPQNAESVAQWRFATCVSCGLLVIIGIVVRVFRRHEEVAK